MRAEAKTEFKALADFLVRNYNEKGKSVDVLVKQKMESDHLESYDDAYEEVIADSCESFLRDATLSDKAEQLYKESPETANAFIRFLEKVIDKIKRYYTSILPQSEEGQIVSEWKDSLNERLQLFIDGVNAAAKNLGNKESSANEDGVKGQNRYLYDDFVSKPDMKITEIKSQETYTRKETISKAKDNARNYGYLDKNGTPFVYVKDTKKYVMLGVDGLKHGLNRAKGKIYPVTEKIGEIISNSIQINELNPKDKNASNAYILLGAAKDQNGDFFLVRSVVNRYGNKLDSVDVLYAINTKKESAANKSPRFANTSLSVTDSTISISNLLDYVNRYYPDILPYDVLKHYGYASRPNGELGKSVKFQSRSDADYLSAVERDDMETAQRMVDEAAEIAFSESKIRDESGKLLKVYHGTDADFTVFDKAMGRSTMDIQGMFFSPWKIDAKGYGPNVRAFYLDIQNPADEKTGYKALNSHKGENYAGIKAREDLESMGYDGVNNSDEEYIAFNSAQIKSADPVTYDDNGNVIPLSERFNTEQKDIRYQGRGNGYSGYSMSNNAVAAYEDGEMPLSKWSKSAILEAVQKLDPAKAKLLEGVKLSALKKNVLYNSSWHHTSSMYNKTEFYAIDEDVIQALTADTVKEWYVKNYKADVTYYEPDSDGPNFLFGVNVEENNDTGYYTVSDDAGNQLIKEKIGSKNIGVSTESYLRRNKESSANEGGVKYSIRRTQSMGYSDQLKKIEQGKLNGSNSLYIGIPGVQIQSVGLSDAPFAMNQSDYRKARRESGNNKHYSSHSVPFSFFKVMPEKINNTAMMIDNGKKVTLVTDYSMKDTNGNDSYVIVGVWQNQAMESDIVNLIKSVYPLDDCISMIKKAADEGKLIVINKNKAENMLATIGVQPSEVSNILNLTKDSLSQSDEDVKRQSRPDADLFEDTYWLTADDDVSLLTHHFENNNEAIGEVLRRTASIEINDKTLKSKIKSVLQKYGVSDKVVGSVYDEVKNILDLSAQGVEFETEETLNNITAIINRAVNDSDYFSDDVSEYLEDI